MGILTQNDTDLFRSWFKEMTSLRGFKVKYSYVISQEPSIYAEMLEQKMSDPIELDIIFETNPTVKTLKRLGWFSESPDDKPYIAYLPFDTPNLKVECRIQIPTLAGLENNDGRWFRITDITSLLEYPDCWICKLAPYISSRPARDNYENNTYSYLDQRSTKRDHTNSGAYSYISPDK